MKNLDKYLGCIIGGAAGDALGYEVEFTGEEQIFTRFGEKGITEYVLHNGAAEISDDTQMTLFTAAGLLAAKAQRADHADMDEYRKYIAESYIDWLCTQDGKKRKHPTSWLANIDGLYDLRAPGNTCLAAISMFNKGICGSTADAINNSKGCGGVMRVAPIGLLFDEEPDSAGLAAKLGAEAAALTHGHSMGYIPGAMLAYIVQLAAHNDGLQLKDIIAAAQQAMIRMYGDDPHMEGFCRMIEKAVGLSEIEGIDDLDAIHEIGQGWVGDEAIAVAIYCALKHADDFDEALIASVNHGGDSDSTGAITGNILGAYLGIDAIPDKYKKGLEMYDVLAEVAQDLYTVYRANDPQWEDKYIHAAYVPESSK